MDKFGRVYRLEIGGPNNVGIPLVVQLPFTIEFDITRNTASSANVAQIKIYNLAENTRNFIRFNVSDTGTYRSVKLYAGYGSNPPLIFYGNISQAWSVREDVDFVTTIESYDGGFAFNNSTIQEPITSPNGKTPRKAYLNNLLNGLDYISPGAIGPSFYTDNQTGEPQYMPRGNSVNGPTASIIKEEANFGFFIDLGVAHLLNNNEFVQSSDQIVINSSSGLLATPVLEETIVRFDMMFEPLLKAGYSAQIDSITGLNYNGLYRINGVKHRGMISDSVCGEAITSGEYFYSKVLFGVDIE